MKQNSVGRAIAELRAERQWTVEQFAECMGVSKRTVTDWESGRQVPNAEDRDVMAELFGISADDLAEGRILLQVFENKSEEQQIEREQDMVKLICRAVALAMGIAVTVLSILKRWEPQSAITMLGIGMTCIGIASFSRKK